MIGFAFAFIRRGGAGRLVASVLYQGGYPSPRYLVSGASYPQRSSRAFGVWFAVRGLEATQFGLSEFALSIEDEQNYTAMRGTKG
jgi:hypothetical protein